MIETHQLAAAAGFFNGEGSFTSMRNRMNGRPYLGVAVTIWQVNLENLRQFRSAVLGLGYIDGPYLLRLPKGMSSRQPIYHYRAHRFEHVQAILALLWRWLSQEKREQAITALRSHHHFRRTNRLRAYRSVGSRLTKTSL